MLKKIICLTLALLMMLAVLTGCADDGDAISEITEDASRYTTTLNMWVVTEEDTDAAQAEAVTKAINKITKSKYKTQLNIKYLTEDEYYTKVEAAFTAHEQAIAAAEEAAKNNRGQGSTNKDAEAGKDETVLNEYGVPELKYPTVPDYQVDILFIGNYEKYRSYIEKGWILGMNGVIENSGGQLSYYINDIFMDALEYNGQIYAISNRRPLGEYTYLMVNEDLMDLYAYSPESFTTYDGSSYSVFSTNCRTFLDYVFAEESVTPIYSATGTVDMSLLHYWNFSVNASGTSCVQNFDTFSLFGGIYKNSDLRGSAVTFGNVLADSTYIDMLANKVYYESTQGYITDTFDPENPSAVCIVTGGAEVRAQYEALGYTALVTETPRAIDSDIYSSMFAIGKYSSQQSRAMEIIAFLNTDAEIRNLLQYGIENVNYIVETTTRTVGEGDEEHTEEYKYVVPTEENRYFMDPYKTGNMFLLYANCEDDLCDIDTGIGILQWEYEKLKNRDALAHPSLGLYFNTRYKVNAKHIRVINAVSVAFEENVMCAFTAEDQVRKIYSDLQGEAGYSDLSTAQYILSMIGEDVLLNDQAITAEELSAALAYMKKSTLDKTKTEQSPNALYNDWLQNSGVNETE